MKRVVSHVNERWADEKFPAKPQVELKVGVEFDLDDHFADLLVSIGKAKHVSLTDQDNSDSAEVPAKPVGNPVSPGLKKGIFKK